MASFLGMCLVRGAGCTNLFQGTQGVEGAAPPHPPIEEISPRKKQRGTMRQRIARDAIPPRRRTTARPDAPGGDAKMVPKRENKCFPEPLKAGRQHRVP